MSSKFLSITPTDIEPGIMDSDSIRVRINKTTAIPEYFSTIAHEANYIKEQFNSGKRGAVLAGLNTSNIENLTIALPPISEQASILKHIDTLLKQYSTLFQLIKTSLSLLKEHRTALISAAVTGKIDVRDQV